MSRGRLFGAGLSRFVLLGPLRMPLVRARCRACTLPLGDPPHAALPVTCARCGVASGVSFAADGQPVDFDPAYGAARLLAWFAHARLAMAMGTLGVAVGACARCASPLVVSSRQPVSLPCPHCGEAVTGPAASVLVDQWAEPWARVEGGGLQLEYRLVVLEDRTGLSAGCAACGATTPAEDPSSRCSRCGAVTWVPHETSRVQLGVGIDGLRDGRPFKAVVPIVQGEASLRADAARGTRAQSGSSLLGVTAVGCAAAIAVVMALVLAIAMAAHFAHC